MMTRMSNWRSWGAVAGEEGAARVPVSFQEHDGRSAETSSDEASRRS